MKKLTAILLMLVLIFSACNAKPAAESSAPASPPESEAAAQPASPASEISHEPDIAAVKQYLMDSYAKVTIDGSTSMIPLHQALNNRFGSNEDVWHSRTVDAFDMFIGGENDILLGVDYSDELLQKAKNSGIELVKQEITREAFVFLMNKNNPVQSLTTSQIKEIYSGKITNWSEVGGDDAPIQAFQRNADSGSQIRMHKFMGDSKLMEQDVKYYHGMGDIVEAIANYDEGKYSIAYNMYTFTEKQYTDEDVVLLNVDGVHPTDESIFDESYPIVIYNYIYHDANNGFASEFAGNLHTYLMSDEGQKLISEAGYVNLNHSYDRNTNVEAPFDYDSTGETSKGFYNEEKGEFYEADDNGNLIVYTSYADYVLHDTRYADNANARAFITMVADSEIPMNPRAVLVREKDGMLDVNPWWDASLDPEDFFNFKYQDKYYSSFFYSIDKDEYILTAEYEKDVFDSFAAYLLKPFADYVDDYTTGATITLTREDLRDLYLRAHRYTGTIDGVELDGYSWDQEGLKIKLEYYQPFE